MDTKRHEDRPISSEQHTENVETGTEYLGSDRGHEGDKLTVGGRPQSDPNHGLKTGEGKVAPAPNNQADAPANSLTGQGDMRLADRITIRIRGDDVSLLMAGDPKERKTTGTELAALIEAKYWDDEEPSDD